MASAAAAAGGGRSRATFSVGAPPKQKRTQTQTGSGDEESQHGNSCLKLVLLKREIIEGDVHDQVYQKLDEASQEVRLLKVLPCIRADQQIRCELSTMSLESRPVYKALSYTWGDVNDVTPILLNGRPFLATKNLEKALRRLSMLGEDVIFWIDALCINQADNDERSSQVRLMRAIYENTEEVLVWLDEGPGVYWSGSWLSELNLAGNDNDVEKINIILEKVGAFGVEANDSKSAQANKHLLGFCLLRLLAGDIHPTEIPLLTDRSLRPFALQAFGLIKKAWFSRIWVVQEIILPPRATVLYGQITTPLTVLFEAALNLQRHQDSCCSKLVEELGFAPQEAKSLIAFTDKILESRSMTSQWRRKDRTSLLSLLRLLRTRAATDDRDKIYALLSLVTDWANRAPIVPDYSASVEKLYTKVAVEMIKGTGSLSVSLSKLSSPSQRLGQKGDLTKIAIFNQTSASILAPSKIQWPLPTWVPDWRASTIPLGAHGSDWSAYDTQFDASAGQPAQVKFIDSASATWMVNPRVLVVAAIPVGTIGSSMPLPAAATGSLKTHMPGLEAIVNAGYTSKARYDGKEAIYDAFWRTLCADVVFSDDSDTPARGSRSIIRRAKADDRKTFEEWRSWVQQAGADAADPTRAAMTESAQMQGTEPVSSEVAGLNRAIRLATVGRQFFLTTNGYMGIAPSVTPDKSDAVYVLAGGGMPFILRKAGNVDLGDGGSEMFCHAMVSPCYVHGIMDGELVGKEGSEWKQEYLI